jgi:hypothetical protein
MSTSDLLNIAPQLAGHGFRSGLLSQKPALAAPVRRQLTPEQARWPMGVITWHWIGKQLGISTAAAYMVWTGERSNRKGTRGAVAELIERHGEPRKRKKKYV